MRTGALDGWLGRRVVGAKGPPGSCDWARDAFRAREVPAHCVGSRRGALPRLQRQWPRDRRGGHRPRDSSPRGHLARRWLRAGALQPARMVGSEGAAVRRGREAWPPRVALSSRPLAAGGAFHRSAARLARLDASRVGGQRCGAVLARDDGQAFGRGHRSAGGRRALRDALDDTRAQVDGASRDSDRYARLDSLDV